MPHPLVALSILLAIQDQSEPSILSSPQVGALSILLQVVIWHPPASNMTGPRHISAVMAASPVTLLIPQPRKRSPKTINSTLRTKLVAKRQLALNAIERGFKRQNRRVSTHAEKTQLFFASTRPEFRANRRNTTCFIAKHQSTRLPKA